MIKHKQKRIIEFPEWFKPFNIDFGILDLIDILKKHNIPQKTARACIKFYAGKNIGESYD